jgi:hypothetical protein
MINEEKYTDFYTTGRQPSQQEFAKISEWIKKDKSKNKDIGRTRTARKGSNSHKKSVAIRGADTPQHQE